MKIAILTPTFSSFSGPDRVVERQAAELHKQGHEVLIFALEADLMPPQAVNIKKWGMPKSSFLSRLYRLFFFLDVVKVKKMVQELHQQDKIISHMYPMTIVAARAKRNYGIHFQYYNMGIAYPELFRNVFERLYMRLFLFFTNQTVKHADSAVSISNFLKEELKREAGIDGTVELCKIRECFKPGISGDKIKKKYNLTFPTLLFVGRISPHKGVGLLYQAFAHVKNHYPEAKLLIVGKHTFAGYTTELESLAQKLHINSNIIVANYLSDEDLPLYYAASDVYTTATLWEGFDLPAAEAQACGKPVVAFNIGAHPEVVKNGIMVKTGDVDAFAEAVLKVLGR